MALQVLRARKSHNRKNNPSKRRNNCILAQRIQISLLAQRTAHRRRNRNDSTRRALAHSPAWWNGIHKEKMENKFGADYHREYYKKRKQKVIDYLGGKCVKCGTTERLEVDHIDPKQKSFHINKRLSLNQIKDELAKCQLLCTPCHRAKTSEENKGFTHGTIYSWMRKRCKCDVCNAAKRIWYDARNKKRRKAS